MEYIKDQDYQYIKNKYHDTKKPFNSLARFIRNDDIFSEDTGMDAEAIKAEFLANDEKNLHLSHHIRKAIAFAYTLDNTRILCDSRDRFPAINAISRSISVLQNKWRRELFGEILPACGAKIAELEQAGIVTIWPDFDHAVPLWERIFSLGFSGLLAESEAARRSKPRNEEEDAFFEGIRLSYEAIIRLILRLADLADKTEGSARMGKALRHIATNPPSTFYEALLVDYLFFIVCEHIDCMQARSLCNFDRDLYRFYKHDIENGVSEEEIRTDLAYFLMQFTAIDNYWNQPVYLGGCDENDVAITNDLSYLFLDVYDKTGLFNPKVQLKISKTTPKEFCLKALDMVRRGHNSIVFVCDETIRQSLIQNTGATEEQARLCDIKGCYEYSIQGSYNIGMNYVNLMKPLEYALHGGRDGISGVMSGLECPSPDSYPTFEAFFAEYERQLKNIIDITIQTTNSFEGYLEYINPASVLSATLPSCLERGKSATVGGALQNNSGIAAGFIADAADSLAMIKKYVFDKKELTLGELAAILDRNYEGHEILRRKLYNDPDKFGNNRELPDRLAIAIKDIVKNNTHNRPNSELRGGTWECGFHVARMSYEQGAKTAASPNGRLFGEELSKNCSAAMGQNRTGATAAILSTTKLDAAGVCGATLDLGLLPSAVSGEDGLEAMYGLVATFMKRGGHALQINVFNSDTLRDAQAHPERYEDLQIRVCGWNVLWNNIKKEEQDGFIRQAENLA